MEILEKRIHKILARISDIADFRRIASEALRGDTNVVVSGLSGSARTLFIAGLWQSLDMPFGNLLDDGLRVDGLPAEMVDRFWMQLGQSLIGVPSSV
jgi:hypothetical protein